MLSKLSTEDIVMIIVCSAMALILIGCCIIICLRNRRPKYVKKDGVMILNSKLNTVNVSVTDSKLVESSSFSSEVDSEVAQLREE